MARDLGTTVGGLRLKNPLVAASGEHLIAAEGVRAALRAGAAVVVVKSTNEVPAAKAQLERAEYAALDARWNPVPWNGDAPDAATIACRSGLYPGDFDAWLAQTAALDREARDHDAYVAASLILGDLDHSARMARAVEAAGLRLLEFNIGTPYASQAAKGAVSTELKPERVAAIVARIRAEVSLPLWIKVTGQSERVPELAQAAFASGADSVVMAGRLLGLVPDVETLAPMLGTSLGVGGRWNLPLTCHWLAVSRAALGPDRPLVGINGACDGLDIARMMLAGASAVGFSSQVMLRGFDLITRALAEFAAYLDRKGIDAANLVGRAADARQTFAAMPERQGNWCRYVPAEAQAELDGRA